MFFPAFFQSFYLNVKKLDLKNVCNKYLNTLNVELFYQKAFSAG